MNLTKNVDLPIGKIYIHELYVPEDPLYQRYTEEELEEKDPSVSFFIGRNVEIVVLDEINSSEDLYFVY